MLVLLLCFSLTAALFFGCSDDAKPTDPDTGLPVGNPSDNEYQAMGESFSGVDAAENAAFEGLFNSIEGISALSPSPSNRLRIPQTATHEVCVFNSTYNDVTKWWHTTLFCTDHEDTVSHNDSIQFFEADVIVQWPTIAVTEIRSGAHVVAKYHTAAPHPPVTAASSDGEGQIDANHNWVITGEIGTAGDIVINGDGGLEATGASENGYCTHELTLSTTYEGILINLTEFQDEIGEDCPTGGTINHSGEASINCNAPSGNGTWEDRWSVVIVFNATGNTATFQNRRAHWTITTLCGEDRDHGNAEEDAEFEAFANSAHAGEEINKIMFDAIGHSLDAIAAQSSPKTFSFPAATADSVSAVYDDVTQTWRVYLDFTEVDTTEHGTDAIHFVVTDYIRLKEGSLVVQWPSTSTTEVQSSMTFAADFNNSNGDDGIIEADHNWTFVFPAGTLGTPATGMLNNAASIFALTMNGSGNGDINFHANDDGANCDFQLVTSHDVTDLVFPLPNGDDICPTSGTLSLEGSAVIGCESNDGNFSWEDSWTATAIYNDGVGVIVLDNTTSHWEFEESCNGLPAASSSVRRLLSLFEAK